MSGVAFVDAMRDADVLALASQLGLKTGRRRCFGPCPSCGAERRHPSRRDPRLACGVAFHRRGWQCFECDATGDAIDLLAFVEHGRRYRDLSAHERAQLHERWARSDVRAVAPQTPREAPPRYPDKSTVEALWRACGPVMADDEVSSYLHGRGVRPGDVAFLHLARALPRDLTAPWATLGGRSWAECGCRLIVPLRDAGGRLRSVLARRVRGSGVKSAAPFEYERRRLVMADDLALVLLQMGAAPASWPRTRVVICEGEMDFLTVASQVSDADEDAPAVFGITSGAWCRAVADRIPDGAEVVIATDPGAAGDRYADRIVASFGRRPVALARWRAAS